MATVAHWAQNRSVDLYPTHILRQVISPVWLGYLALHFQILFKGDYLANSIQWTSMLGCLIGVSLIAKELGLSLWGQWLSAFLVATLPMGILEASSMQGDYAVAFWIVCAIYILISYKNLSFSRTVLFALSISLAILTKGTGLVFSIPLLIGLLLRIKFNLVKTGLVLGIILIMLSGYLVRIHQLSPKNILIACDVHHVSINLGDISNSTIEANLLRNIGMHLGTPDQDLNKKIEKCLYQLGSLLKININDPKASFVLSEIHLSKPSHDENFATNPWHAVLYLCCLAFLCVFVRNKRIWVYTIYIAGMLLCLCAFVLWQPWSSRFHLPLFVLLAPVAAYVLERIKFRIIALIIIFVFFILAIPYLTDGHPRHLWGSQSFLKKSRAANLLSYSGASSEDLNIDIKNKLHAMGCDQIGLLMGEDDWDYPFYAFLNPHQKGSIRIEHVLIDNLTKDVQYPLGDFSPCAIIGITGLNTLNFHHKTFDLIFTKDNFKIFTKK